MSLLFFSLLASALPPTYKFHYRRRNYLWLETVMRESKQNETSSHRFQASFSFNALFSLLAVGDHPLIASGEEVFRERERQAVVANDDLLHFLKNVLRCLGLIYCSLCCFSPLMIQLLVFVLDVLTLLLLLSRARRGSSCCFFSVFVHFHLRFLYPFFFLCTDLDVVPPNSPQYRPSVFFFVFFLFFFLTPLSPLFSPFVIIVSLF